MNAVMVKNTFIIFRREILERKIESKLLHSNIRSIVNKSIIEQQVMIFVNY